MVIGFVVCIMSSLIARYTLSQTIDFSMRSGSTFNTGLSALSSIINANLLGCGIIFLGILFGIISMFTGKKQNIN